MSKASDRTNRELAERAKLAQDAYEAMSPVEKVQHDDAQRRSWVKGQTGQDLPPDPRDAEIERLRAEVDRLTNMRAEERKGSEAIRSIKMMADSLRSRGVLPSRDESNLALVGRAVHAAGCVCPPGSEATCRGPLCPRKPIGPAT